MKVCKKCKQHRKLCKCKKEDTYADWEYTEIPDSGLIDTASAIIFDSSSSDSDWSGDGGDFSGGGASGDW